MGKKSKASATGSTALKSCTGGGAPMSNTQIKKAARAQLAAAVNEKRKILEDAQALEDPTSLLPDALKSFKKNGIEGTLSGQKADGVVPTLMEAAFVLCRTNMKDLYNKTDFNENGWNDKVKLRELAHEEARYLFLTDANDGELIGFAHFRFEPDEETDDEVMYLYEIQLVSSARRKGLGRYFMVALEIIARKLDMKKIVCTVLKENVEGAQFFKNKLGFKLDPSSPEYIEALHGTTKTASTDLVVSSNDGASEEGLQARRVLEQLMVDPEDEEDGVENRLAEFEILSKTLTQLKPAPSLSTSTSASPPSAASQSSAG